MRVALRAAWRLARSVVHGLHGLAIVLLQFGSLDTAQRHARVRWWAAKLLRLMGVTLQVEGSLEAGGAMLVANHVSWLDINVLHAVAPHARFVSKSDVKSWPLLSQLADAADTLYLERERKRDALRVVHLVANALAGGETVAVFPEGTTSDGHRLLPFHANLLQAAVATATPVQPVALRFADASQTISDAVEFVGKTTLVESLWRVASCEGLIAHVTLLPPRASAHVDRRALARALRSDIATHLYGSPPA
jgi:1-acyl-sn-glycerol-3-phosphate acyltransferase